MNQYLVTLNKAVYKVLLFAVCFFLYAGESALGQTLTTNLYLSDADKLDRVDPVSTADITTSQSVALVPGAQYLYALRGASRIDFWRYNISSNSWSAMATTPGTISRGGALATNGTYIYALRGGTTDFWRYDPVANTWATMAATPAAVSSGARLVFVNGALYTFRGGASTTFWKYTISTNTWSVLSVAPSTVDWGASLTTNGTDIFALKGSASATFWKYTVATDTWSVLAALPATADAGGSLSFDGIAVYALRGGSSNNFYKYNLTSNTWSALSNTPNSVSRGGSLVSDDPATYALRGGGSGNFWKYDGSSWSSLAGTPSSIDSGGAIIKFGNVARTATFTQSAALCSALTIKAGTVTVSNYITPVYGVLPANPSITATLRYGGTTILALSSPAYNSGTGLITWTGTLPADVTIPATQSIALDISTLQNSVSFKIDYDAQTKPSKITFPVSTYVNVTTVEVYNAAYPGGMSETNLGAGSTKYIRTTVTDPFGYNDITSLSVSVTPGTTTAGTQVAAAGCTKVFENTWTVPLLGGAFSINATAKEGYENTITHSKSLNVTTCVSCPPTANKDFATVNGGEPVEIDVLANDADPNNDIDPSSLTVTVEPKNGQVIISDDKITYLPNGTFQGNDTLTYEICDRTLLTPQCSEAQVVITVLPVAFNTCADATKSKIYYMPYAENDAQIALKRSGSVALPTTNIRTIISIKVSYPGMTLIWDNWEDGYETNILSPTQSTTAVWGDGNLYNGIAPGYPTDVIPSGGSIVLDNIMATPRVVSDIYYDGKDKLYASGQVSVTQVCGEPATIAVQCMKTNVSAYPSEYGKSFTLPVGQDLPSRDFRYVALFIRAAEDNTTIQIDRDNNGTFNTTFTLNEGEVMMVDENTAPAGTQVKAGAVITSDKPIGVDAHFAGVDNFSSREVPIFPATWYSNVYYTPVPTTGPSSSPKDTAVVMLYNSLSRDININWTSGIPSSGTILLKANASERFAMPLSAAAAFKFTNPTKESFVAIEIVDSYTPGGGGNAGDTRDWAFNLISENRLTDFASVAWAPGSTDMSRNDNPIWVTPSANTIVYVKYDGDVLSGPSTSPCGLKYDVAIPLNALNYVKIKDAADNNQSGTAVYTCNGAKIAAVYGEDPATASTANPSWDVGSTIQPFCKEKLIFANTDFAVTLVNTPVTIGILKNDAGFLAVVNPASVTTTGLLQPQHGTVKVNSNGSVVFIPATGFVGVDSFQYNVCSTPFPVVCATAMVYVTIGSCPTPTGQNFITGQVFLDKNGDGIKNDGGTGYSPAKIYLYVDGNCNNTINVNELVDSTTVDANGYYQFTRSPEKTTSDNFDLSAASSSCASGTDGSVAWTNNWVDNDASVGFCVTPAQSAGNTDVEIVKDSIYSYALRLDDFGKSAYREFNIQNATQAFLSFAYRFGTNTLSTGESIAVQLSKDNSTYNTVYTIAGNNTYNSSYINVSNIPITVGTYNGSNKIFIRFLTNNNVDEGDLVYIDNVEIRYLQYSQCYMLSLNTAELPASSIPSTAVANSASFASAGTCAGSMDFGIKRISTNTVNDENSTWQNVNVSGLVKQNDFDQEAGVQTFGTFLNPSTLASIATGSIVRGTSKSGASIANAGTIIYDADGNYTFDPEPSFTGSVTIPYKICDNGTPSACDTAYLVITVDPLPASGNSVIANNDEDISYGQQISNNLLVNDRDPKYNAFTVTLFSYDTNGDGIPDVNTMPGTTVTVAGIDITGAPVANAGSIIVAADGSYTFKPASGFTGMVKAAYTITNTGGSVALANLSIDVLSDINGIQNDPPFAGDDFGYTTVNQPLTGNFISNDREPNNDSLSLNGRIINTANPATAIGALIATTQGGKIQFYTDGTYRYFPPAGYIGPDLVTYSICDVTTTAPQPLCGNAIIHFLIGPGINITGKVWNDANGDVVGQPITEPVTNGDGLLYVNLVNELGYVVTAVPVAADGTYSFNDVSPGKNYSLILSNVQGTPGTLAPAPALPAGWINTGETRNGTIDYGSQGIIDDRSYSYVSATNLDFGIERTPTSVPFYINIPAPTIGQQIVLNGGSNPPILSGRDDEDMPAVGSLTGRSLSIDAPPLNSNLYYAGVLVTAGQVITNFNPSLLKIEFTAVTVASSTTSFQYSFIDAAGKKDGASAEYSLNWFVILPVKDLTLAASRTGNSVALNWKTNTEINSDYFELERSTDTRNYSKAGTRVKAAGNSNTEKSYQQMDDIKDLQVSTIYYRVKLTDIDGKVAYSNVAVVKLPSKGEIKVTPNPFVSDITITMPVEQNTTVSIRMLDISGRAILNTSKKVSKDLPQVTFNNLNGLLKGVYVIEVIDMQTGKKLVTKLEKN